MIDISQISNSHFNKGRFFFLHERIQKNLFLIIPYHHRHKCLKNENTPEQLYNVIMICSFFLFLENTLFTLLIN